MQETTFARIWHMADSALAYAGPENWALGRPGFVKRGDFVKKTAPQYGRDRGIRFLSEERETMLEVIPERFEQPDEIGRLKREI